MSNSDETSSADSNNINTKQVIKVIGFIVLGVVGFYFANFHNGLSIENGDWGTFGDYLGGILNPVIAAFAFYLVSETYKLQKRELEETRKLLKVSTDAQNDQVKLAALTALLNSNLTRISLLESERIELVKSKNYSTGDISKIDEKIENVKQRINELEEQINVFLKEKTDDFCNTNL